jgi:predicted nucleic acid-binding protein
MQEYYTVLRRPKFVRYPDFCAKAESLLALIELKAVKYIPTGIVSLITDDADNRLLELSDESNADYLITGNTNHFNFPDYHNTKIISSKQYWEQFGRTK